MLWVDKYRPKKLDKLLVHQDIGENLIKLVSTGDCPHTLFYGPSGAGKKTLIVAMLRQLYGPGVEKVKVETRPWKISLPSRNLEVELTTVSSNYHVEMNPSDAGFQDRHVVQEVIKEMCRNRPIELKGGGARFKTLILNEVDRLSKEAQHSLRRTMEKYSSTCRLVFACNNVSKVIEPLRSRCLCIRVPAPSHADIQQLLAHAVKKEGLQALPGSLAQRISEASGRNMRQALLMAETCRVAQYPWTESQPVQLPDWELYTREIASLVLAEQSPKRLLEVRGKLYELLVNCLGPELILRTLLLALLPKLDDSVRRTTAQRAAAFEHRLQQGQKPIFHLEAFIARFMCDYKQFLVSAYG